MESNTVPDIRSFSLLRAAAHVAIVVVPVVVIGLVFGRGSAPNHACSFCVV
jgi:hypothetical protein